MTNDASFSIPSSSPGYGEDASDALQRVLSRNHTAEGPEAQQLQDELSETLKVASVEVTSSGSAALHLALMALDLGEGDEVIVPSYTCLAVLNAVTHTGAEPVIADVNRETMSLSYETVQNRLSNRTAAIILVHNFGRRITDRRLYDLEVPIVDDLAQGLGTTEQPPQGELAVGSFYATKTISGGQGGFVATDHTEYMDEIRDLKQYDRRETYRETYNYSLSDLCSALAREQMKSLERRVRRRREIAARYDDALGDLPDLSLPSRGPDHSYYRYVIQTERRDELQAGLRENEIEAKPPVYKPLHRYYGNYKCPTSDKLASEALLLPVYSGLNEEQVERIISSIICRTRG